MTVNPKLKKTFESIMENDIETARSLFHDVVVEMSKEIYRTLESEDSTFDFDFEEDNGDLLDPDFDEEEFDITQITRGLGEDGEVEDLEFELETEPEAGDFDANGIDAEEDFEEVEGEEDSLEDRIDDIEDAFEELKREFEAIVGGDVDAESEEEAEDVAISDLDVDGDNEEVVDLDIEDRV